MEALDQAMIANETTVKYGGGGLRFVASLVDTLVLLPLTFGISYYNIISWKSSAILISVNMLCIIYKPAMELLYGATLGKMAVKLQVVNAQYEQPNINDILIRNVFQIVPGIIMLFITVWTYSDPEFETITGFTEYSVWSSKFMALQFGNYAVSALMIVDGIVLLADKQSRAWHDKIASTFVVQRS
jgi:uncharacterized RDD family membrane protein YckC